MSRKIPPPTTSSTSTPSSSLPGSQRSIHTMLHQDKEKIMEISNQMIMQMLQSTQAKMDNIENNTEKRTENMGKNIENIEKRTEYREKNRGNRWKSGEPPTDDAAI
uniref:Uncharacterized protein n=1 Tax=Micrurus lemniscatus lemniscatus TaxID=129467 RepID=A0A2D4H8Y5_MICLE